MNPPALPAPMPHPPRLVSLDALRGFDMFWIVGAGDLVRGLQKGTTWTSNTSRFASTAATTIQRGC